METPLFALEIFSGTCCLLSSVFLHFFSYPAKQKDLIYQKGLMYIKLALIIMGVSTLFFAITESFRLPNAKSYFIQILLPIETLLVLYAMIHLMNASKKFRKVMVYNDIYACVLCVISITYIYFMSKQGEKWIYYLLVLCYLSFASAKMM